MSSGGSGASSPVVVPGGQSAAAGTTLSKSSGCDLDVRLTADRTAYAADVDPRFTVVVADTGKGGCQIDVSRSGIAVTVRSGDDRIWSTADCPAEITAENHTLAAGGSYSETVVWPRSRSLPGCVPNQPLAESGYYSATVAVSGVSSDKVTFELS